MQPPTSEICESSSSPRQVLDCAPQGRSHRKGMSFRLALASALFHYRSYWRSSMYIWRGAARSFLGHIRTLSPTEPLVPHCGPALAKNHLGQYQANIRTVARNQYIKALWAKLPYLDILELRIFLMGFDAGEQFATRKVDTETSSFVEVPSWDTYFLRQASKLDSGQISEAIPAAIAGVIRSDECTRQKL